MSSSPGPGASTAARTSPGPEAPGFDDSSWATVHGARTPGGTSPTRARGTGCACPGASRPGATRLPRLRRRGRLRRRLRQRAPPRPASRRLHALRLRRDGAPRGRARTSSPCAPTTTSSPPPTRSPPAPASSSTTSTAGSTARPGCSRRDAVHVDPTRPRLVRRLRDADERDRGGRGPRRSHARPQRLRARPDR